MGKYTALRNKLPAFTEETKYQERINEEKALVLAQTDNPEDASVTYLASLFGSAKIKKDLIEEELSGVNLRLEALSQLLVDALAEQSIEKVTLASGATGYIQDTPYPVVRDKEAVLEWIKKNKMSSLLGVNYQTLKGITNERLVAGQALIPGTEVFLKTQFRLRNGNADSE